MNYAQPKLITRLIHKRDVKHRMTMEDDDGFLMKAMLPLYAKMSRATGELPNKWRNMGSDWLTHEQAKGCMFNA